MKAILFIFGLSFLLALTASGTLVAAQEAVVVTAIKANLRGTPSNLGIVVTTVSSGETFELIKEKAPWYLVQAPKYVGWIHGNAIALDSTRREALDRYLDQFAKPRKTSKPISNDDSPFQREYVGGDSTSILIQNQTDRLLTLLFGGIQYKIAAGDQREIEVDGGRYEYSASVPRARPTGGVKEFQQGYRFSWRFYIVRR